ncbi:unnamed protein product [Caenorhabditis auriculariae]|uniref:Nose resistant-to-fluoxetine protein N-terminal domain-containing protein n=1 Tax=Caenorhabditis auriculariae TaxID=2777116 RepID=A0A8S1GY23_9PELO|nr:unnamed protein product [Caenorhabditis auriculariae]
MRLGLALLPALLAVSQCCTLCPFRTPPRPRPIDQYKLPSISAASTFEKMPQFCNASRALPVEHKCREQFERIFCSIDLLIESFNGCEKLSKDRDGCSQCAHQKADNMWVLKWFDSLGKPAAGISDGNYYWLGDYEMCTDLRYSNTFDGQYCRVEVEVPDVQVEQGCPQTDPLSIVVGICFPSSCSVDQLTLITQKFSPYKVTVECESDSSWSMVTYILMAMMVVWLTPQFVASARKEIIDSALSCFSISENSKRAFSTRRGNDGLHVVHGLEFFAFIFIICGNVYNMMLPYIENVAFSFEGVKSLWMHPVNNYSYQIDGLLALSAFYTTFLLYGQIDSGQQAFGFIALRFFRFWPAYVFCVLFMYVIFPGLGAGPMWIHTETVERCESSWWKNILFINNFFSVDNTCVDFGYVISLEAQFYITLVFCIWLSRSHLRWAKLVAYLGIIASVSFSFYRAYFYSLPPAPMLTVEPVPLEKTRNLFDLLMLSPLTRISPYCMGFIFGVGCATAEDRLRNRGFSYKPHILLGVICVTSAATAMFAAVPYAAEAKASPLPIALYATFHRPLWAFALLSFVYLCHHGAFVWLNALLGWRVFAPLSKMSWLALVLSEPVILYFFSSLNKPAYATHWSTVYTSVSAAVMSYLLSFALDIFLSRPIRYLIYREQKHRYAAAHISVDHE